MDKFSAPVQPANEINDSLPCVFEESPPYLRWMICRTSTFHLPKQPIAFLHYHMEMEIGFCATGEGSLYLGNKIIPYRAGDAQIILPCQTHYNVSSSDNTVWHFVSFLPEALHSNHISPDPAFLRKLTSDCRLSGVFPPDKYPALVQSLASIVDLAVRAPDTPFDEDCLLTELLNLLVLLSRTERDRVDSPAQINQETNKIMPALVAFSKELEKGRCLTIAEMAELCHFSQSYFRKLFTDIMGKHPKKYILKQQLSRASQLLITTDLPISEVQRQTGFSDASVFFRNFTNRYHLSPSAYRKKYGEKESD